MSFVLFKSGIRGLFLFIIFAMYCNQSQTESKVCVTGDFYDWSYFVTQRRKGLKYLMVE